MTEETQLTQELGKLNLSLSDSVLKEWQIESDRRKEEIELDKERILIELGVRDSAAKKDCNHKSVVVDIGTGISKVGPAGS
jgi:tRNA threonylcarbamoyladenosine modification (KEOPS) complex  Pcc1 subunit